MKENKTFMDLNFPASARETFDILAADESWTWFGLARTLADKYSLADLEELHYAIGEILIESER